MKNLALFDFDGTITTKPMMPDFMVFAVEQRRLLLGRFAIAPTYIGYKLGWVGSNTLRASLVRFGFRNVPEERLAQLGERFAREVLPGVIRPEALQKIRWHKAQGDRVIVVSGALDVYLAHWCREQQLEMMCSQLEVVDGVLTGRYRGEQCVRAEKVRRVREKYDLRDFGLVYAYGDTDEDREMLDIADKKIFCWREID